MKNKGITLLVLIVTVIIMIILASVTINLITNGGLIEKTRTAVKDYQYEADKEQFELAKVSATNYLTEEIDEEELEGSLEGWTHEGKTWTSPNGNEFTLDSKSSEGKNDKDLDLLKKYILGEDLKGRPLWNDIEGTEKLGILEFNDEEDTCFFVDSTGMLDKGLVEIPEYISEDWSQYEEKVLENIYYIKYNGSYYKFGTICEEIHEEQTGEDSSQIIEMTSQGYGVKKIEDIKISTSKEKPGIGSKIYYDNQKWTVMYAENDEIQMVSDLVKYYDETKVDDEEKELYLGYNDSYLIKYGELEETTEIEESIYSYNNVIDTLNKACEEIVDTNPNYIIGVRCVGSNPKEKNSENSTEFTSDFLVNYPSGNAVYNGVGKSSDENYISDYERMIQLGINKASYTGEWHTEGGSGAYGDGYWLASRFVGVGSTDVFFRVRYVGVGSYCGTYYLWSVNETEACGYYDRNGLRPVVSLKPDICNFTWNEANGYYTLSEK